MRSIGDATSFQETGDIGRELIGTENNPTPEGLETLPHRYSEMPQLPIE